MNLTSSSMLLALAVASGFGCSLIKINGKSLGGSGPSLTTGESSPTESDASDAAAAGSPISLPSAGPAGKTLDDIARPSAKAAVTSWTPAQQYLLAGGWGSGVPNERSRGDLGFGDEFGSVALADELGAKLSHLGRLSLIEECLGGATDASSAVSWAVCGEDVRLVDLAAADAELRAEGIGDKARNKMLKEGKTLLDAAKQVGAAVEAAAKDDPGIAAILAEAKAARAEWKAYASAHREVIANVSLMLAAARAGLAKNYAGCAEKTRPAFEKLVRAKKFTMEESHEPLIRLVDQLRTDLDSHLVTLAFAACAAGLDPDNEGMYAVIGPGGPGQVLRGERTLVVAKLYAGSFNPKFDDRELSMSKLRHHRGHVKAAANPIAAVQSSSLGARDIAKVSKNGDKTTLTFKSEQVERCVEARETNKVNSVDSSGNVHYQQECVRHEWVASQPSDAEISTLFDAGLAPGVSVVTVRGIVVTASKGTKLRAIMGVALK